MNKITTGISVALFLITLSLGIYVLKLKDLIEHQTGQITALEVKCNDAEIAMKKGLERNMYYANLLKRLEDDYSSYKELEADPSYIRYKAEIEAILEENIENIVDETPLNNGQWFFNKVRFLGPAVAAVYYEDGHNLSTTLVQITKTDNGYRLEKIA